MTIGKSTRSHLSGSSITNDPVLTTSTTYTIDRSHSKLYNNLYLELVGSSYDSSSSNGEDPSFGLVYITLYLASFSLTEMSDDNSLDMLDFIANIGGFWEVLLMAWGLFFIAKQATPKQKARNFAKAIQKGNRRMSMEGPWPSPAVTSDAEHGGEERPNWDIADGRPRQANGSGIGGRVLANESTV